MPKRSFINYIRMILEIFDPLTPSVKVHLYQPSIVCEHCLQTFANRSSVGVNTGFANPAQEHSQVFRYLSVNLRMLKEIQCLLRVQCEQHMYVSSAFKFASSCT